MIPTSSIRRFMAIAWFAIAGLCTSHAAAQTTPKSSDDAKVARLLEGTGHNFKTYNTATGPVWSIEEVRGSLKTRKLLAGTNSGVLVIGVVVAEKAHMNVTLEFTRKLLRLSHTMDRVKLGFDSDDDLFVRIESPVRLLDAQDFKAQIDQVVAAADEIDKQLGSFISSQ